jgi:hypothetical protein
MEMAVRSMETAETMMETNGDGSRGTSLSRQGAITETSVPQNLSSKAGGADTGASCPYGCSLNSLEVSYASPLTWEYWKLIILH